MLTRNSSSSAAENDSRSFGRVRHLADLERKVDAFALIGVDGEAVVDVMFETGRLRRYAVGSREQERQRVLAVVPGDGFKPRSGFGLDREDFRARNYGLRLIDNPARDGGANSCAKAEAARIARSGGS